MSSTAIMVIATGVVLAGLSVAAYLDQKRRNRIETGNGPRRVGWSVIMYVFFLTLVADSIVGFLPQAN